jgi:hypothetical protein
MKVHVKNSHHCTHAAQACTTFKTYAGGHKKWLPEMSQTTIKMKAAFNIHKKIMWKLQITQLHKL